MTDEGAGSTAAEQGSPPVRRREVRQSAAGLAVFEYGREPGPGVPSLLLIHGYPDDHQVFLPVIAELAGTHHMIAYDTRNAGESRVAADGGTADYSLAALVDDAFAVLSAVGVGNVHLVGHDWGSIQGWAVVRDPRATGAITRYTSISGPDMGHFSRWINARIRRPREWGKLGGQLLRSWYLLAFQLPVLPEAAWRLVLTRRFEQAANRPLGDNPVRGLALYRSNLFGRGARTDRPQGASRRVNIPVQVVVPLRDAYLSPHLTEDLEGWIDDLTVVRVDGGHWWPASRPAEFARLLRGGGS
ncbi:alpha/beta fold hydrolase [Arthrobacter sp. YD4]|uniref:alpha/beta fold hydrolase n=1 Tax=Arthrobacter sp. YD4 TaxID=3058043 RepID=UPI0025B5339B|nr:alpha/beta fold hydrolase [Arthrobacter sp. YD4]MDN3936711.1 alpha/beta fold hydrolase [Arthrobacter sp. YD4]